MAGKFRLDSSSYLILCHSFYVGFFQGEITGSVVLMRHRRFVTNYARYSTQAFGLPTAVSHSHDSCGRIIPRYPTNGHESTKRVKQILPKVTARDCIT